MKIHFALLLISSGLSYKAVAQNIKPGDYFMMKRGPVQVANNGGEGTVLLVDGTTVSASELNFSVRLEPRPSRDFLVRLEVTDRSHPKVLRIYQTTNRLLNAMTNEEMAIEVAGGKDGLKLISKTDINAEPTDRFLKADEVPRAVRKASAKTLVELEPATATKMLNNSRRIRSFDYFYNILDAVISRANFLSTDFAANSVEKLSIDTASVPGAELVHRTLVEPKVDIEMPSGAMQMETLKAAQEAVRITR